jgi:hypothetical protein
VASIKTGRARSASIKGGKGGVRLKHINKLAKTPNARGHSARPQGLSGVKSSPVSGRDTGGGKGRG